MEIFSIIAAACLSTFIACVLYPSFFKDHQEFWSSLAVAFKPRFFSWLSGSLGDDYGKRMKMGVYLLCVFGSGVSVWLILNRF